MEAIPTTDHEAPTGRTPASTACDHCGLPVPLARLDPLASLQFCCGGCATVYEVIRSAGLGSYYALRDQADPAREPARSTGRSFEELDEPAFGERYCRDLGDGLRCAELYVEGVHCAACVWLLEKLPVVAPAVASAELDMGRSRLRITWDAASTRLSSIARAIDSLGYAPHPLDDVDQRELRAREDRVMLARIAVAFACAGNVMLMASALYGGWFSGMDAEYETLFRWASLFVSIPAVFWAAAPMLQGAWSALRTWTPHMDLPLSVGILAGFGFSAFDTVRGKGEIYFDSITVLVLLLLVGRFVQRRQQRAALDATELVRALAPSTARLVTDDGSREVPAESVAAGALVEIRAGDHVAVDGIVVDGESTLDRALLTGEARPETVRPGSLVEAGCTNSSGRLIVRTERAGMETRIAKLADRMVEANRRRAPVVRLADAISGWFVVAVLGLAAVTFVAWHAIDATRALEHTLALLVVTCPCALGIGTPLAIAAALGRAARRGILVKGGAALEALSRPGLVVFDKTGTLTRGDLEVVAWHGDEAVRPLVAAAEAHSAHPIARALVRAAGGSDPSPCRNVTVRQSLSRGVEATVDGHDVVVGAPDWVATGRTGPPDFEAQSTALADRGLTPVAIAVDGVVVAVAGLGDPIRDEAPAVLRRLRDRGWQLAIVSGDHPRAVTAVARELDVELDAIRGGVSPEGKLAFVETATRDGTVLMVGDGVNDAAALAAASVGLAVHGGAETSLIAADAFATRDGLGPVLELVEGAQRTVRVIHRNLAFSLVYNVVGASLAVAGFVTPLLAALLMPLSSITVVAASYRSRTFS